LAVTSTLTRVPAHTSSHINQQIQNDIAEKVHYYSIRTDQIPGRLQELEDEWDIERAIEANASALALTGVVLGATSDRRWLILPALVTAFLFQHAIQGWCPPIPILRRLGFRTAHEIEQERNALKAIRGDFEGVSRSPNKPAAALRAVGA
jgi:hypothetical protein